MTTTKLLPMSAPNLPHGSMLHEEARSFTYSDSFTVPLKRKDVANWELVAALFHSAPPWFEVLARLRDRIVRVFGLKTANGNPRLVPPPYLPGQHLGFFRVLRLSEQEVLLGDEDKHLDFLTSLMLVPAGDGVELAVSTVVTTKNLLGRLYLAIVKHVHRLVVPIMTRGMARIIDERALPPHFYSSSSK